MTDVARDGLHHAMDARAANLEQDRLLHNPDPEINSIAEFAPYVRAEARPKFEVLVGRTLRSNIAEGNSEMEMAGLMEDELARKRLAPTSERWTAKRIARELRDPLAVIAAPAKHDGIAFYRACTTVRELVRELPSHQLLSGAVRHELRATKFALLAKLIATHHVADELGGAA